KLSVGPPFFDLTFTPFMIVLAMLLPLGAMVPWKRGATDRVARVLWGPIALSIALGAAVWAWQTGGRLLAPIGTVLAAWVVLGAFADLADRIKLFRAGAGESARRAANLPRAELGKLTAHTGFGLMIFAIAAITAWELEDIRVVQPGERFAVGAYTLELEGVRQIQGPNYTADRAELRLYSGAQAVGLLTPEKRFYPVQRMPTTEAGLDIGFWRDVYVVIGDQQADGGWVVRTYIKPFANWIWGSAIIMALGGALSLTDRRYRLGAPAPRRGAAPVPAE
ncbi:MAG: cytochrome c-type biogenesis CcmF C-terminal domain-containing protein, partial [Pseudomonadota bacterium]